MTGIMDSLRNDSLEEEELEVKSEMKPRPTVLLNNNSLAERDSEVTMTRMASVSLLETTTIKTVATKEDETTNMKAEKKSPKCKIESLIIKLTFIKKN